VELLGAGAALFDVDDAVELTKAIHRALNEDAPARPTRTWDDCADAWVAMWRAACPT
jgi:hypothetical protein